MEKWQETQQSMLSHLGVEDDVRIALVQLALVRLVRGRLLDHLELLHAPDLETGTLSDPLVAGVEHGGHAKRRLKLCCCIGKRRNKGNGVF